MSSIATLFGIFVLGLAAALAWGPRRDTALCCALAFPTGLIASGLLVLASLYANTRLQPTFLVGAAILALAAARQLRRHWRPIRIDVLIMAAALALFASLAVLFTLYDSTFFNYLSYKSVFAAQRLRAPLSSFYGDIFHDLSETSPIGVAIHGVAEVFDQDYFSAGPPLLVGSIIAIVGATVRHAAAVAGTSKWITWLTAVSAMLALGLQSQFLHIGLYVHHPALVMLFVTVFVCTWWIAELHHDASVTPIAWLALLGLCLSSDVGCAVGLTAMAVALFATRLDVRTGAAVVIAILLAVLGAWSEDFPSTSKARFFSAGEARAYCFIAVTIYVFWVAAREHAYRWFSRSWTRLVLVAAVISALIASSMSPSAEHLWRATRLWNWNVMPLVAACFAVVALLAARLPFRRLFAASLPAFVVVAAYLGNDQDAEYFAAPFGGVHQWLAPVFPIVIVYGGLEIVWRLGTREHQLPRISAPPPALGTAFCALLLGTLAFNAHSAGVWQTVGRTKTLALAPTNDLAELARNGGSTIREKYALYFLLDDLIDPGGHVCIDRSLVRHSGYIASLVDIEVELGDCAIPAAAALRLEESAQERLALRTVKGALDVHIILGADDGRWVLGPDASGESLFWLPESLYRELGGQR